MAAVVIFGTRDTAELAYHYLRDDSPHEVVAFTVSADYRQGDTFLGLPLVPFESLETIYPPDRFECFVPMTARGMNQPRAALYSQLKARTYRCVSYISSKATVLTGAIGENCLILEGNVIQHGVSIGDDVMLWSGNHIGHHSRISSHNFITSHVVVSGHCTVGSYCFLGVNATLREGLRLGEGTFLAMASALTRDSEPWSVYRGNPARRLSVDSRRFYP
jgi:sugar O-acyltransferase (sialic acid O-acetyltransferase NeuD family)